jgi:methanogenic corrinoid protein MtbC1
LANLINQKYYEEYLCALLKGRRDICSKFVSDYLAQSDNVIEFYETIVKKSMYEIGVLWEHNKISVATEHLTSTITESIVNRFFYELQTGKKLNKKILLSCVENEQHQIGLKMVADIFELYGWDTFILGANTPVRDLIKLSKDINPDFIALSLTMYFNLPVLELMILEIRNEFNYQKILVGGQAFTRGGHEILNKYDNVFYFNDLYSIEKFLKN